MKKLFLISLSLLNFGFCSAQHNFTYSLSGYGRDQYFTDGEEIYPLRDRWQQNLNMGHYLYYNAQSVKSCSRDSSYWFTSYLKSEGYGANKLDSLKIENLSDSDIAKQFPDGNKLITSWSAARWETFHGISDSVKTVTFRLERPSQKPEQLKYESLYFRVSQSHGMIETRLMNYKLNQGELEPLAGPGNKVWLAGEQGTFGWQYLTDRSINDFKIGDEFHYLNTYSRQINFPGFSYTEKTEKTVLRKTVINDSVQYVFSRKRETEPNTPDVENKEEIITDTVTETYSYSSVIRNLNVWYTANGLGDTLIMYFFNYRDGDSVLYTKGSSCGLQQPHTSKRVKGLGTVDWRKGNAFAGETKHELVYFKKGTKEWGKPLLLNTDEEIKTVSSYTVSPNPASGQLVVTTLKTTPATFKMYTFTGNLVLSEALHQSESSVNLNSVLPGVYFYEVVTTDKRSTKGKVVVQ